jgi:hypothetical protein
MDLKKKMSDSKRSTPSSLSVSVSAVSSKSPAVCNMQIRPFDVTSMCRDAQIAILYRRPAACAQTIGALVRALTTPETKTRAACGSSGARRALEALNLEPPPEFVTMNDIDGTLDGTLDAPNMPRVTWPTIEVVHDHHYDAAVMQMICARTRSPTTLVNARITTCMYPRQLENKETAFDYVFVDYGDRNNFPKYDHSDDTLASVPFRVLQSAGAALIAARLEGYIVIDRTSSLRLWWWWAPRSSSSSLLPLRAYPHHNRRSTVHQSTVDSTDLFLPSELLAHVTSYCWLVDAIALYNVNRRCYTEGTDFYFQRMHTYLRPEGSLEIVTKCAVPWIASADPPLS